MRAFVSLGLLRMQNLERTIDADMEANGLCALWVDDCDWSICWYAGLWQRLLPAAGARQMPQLIEQYAADRMSLNRIYPLILAPARMDRFEKFDNDKLAMLAAMNFDKLSEEDQIDYLLLKNRLTADLHHYAIQKKQVEEMAPLLPFAKTIEDLLDRKREMKRPEAEKDAAALTEMVKQIEATRKQLDPKPPGATGDAGRSPRSIRLLRIVQRPRRCS